MTFVPARALSARLAHPAKFCPMSKMNTPGVGSETATGSNVAVTLIGGWGWALSGPTCSAAGMAPRQARSSKPGSAQPSGSSRASYTSPR